MEIVTLYAFISGHACIVVRSDQWNGGFQRMGYQHRY